MNLPWHPTFVVGSTTYDIPFPVTRWIPGERTTGSAAQSAEGVSGNEVRLRRYTLGMDLRFHELQWPTVRAFITRVQSGREFTWIPNPEGSAPHMPTDFTVTLESPRVTDPIRPVRDASYPEMMFLPIVLGSRTVFYAYYFPTDYEPNIPPYEGSGEVFVGLGPPGDYDGVFVGIEPYYVGRVFNLKLYINSKPNRTTGVLADWCLYPPGCADTSASVPITITFDKPVTSVTISAYDAQGISYMVAYDVDDVEIDRKTFSYLSGYDTIAMVEGSAIRRVDLLPAAGDWLAFYDLKFTH